MILTVIRKHLQPRVPRPAINTRYSFCSSVFQRAGQVNQTQFTCVPKIYALFILQELKRPPSSPFTNINTIESRIIRMNNSDNYQINPHRNQGKDVNRDVELQLQDTPYKRALDHEREEHASPFEGQQDQLEKPPKKKKVKVEMEATSTPSASENTSTFMDNGVKDCIFSSFQNKAENDTQHNIDHNKEKFYVENEVSGIKNSRQHTDHISIHIENHHDSTVSNAQDPPAPLNSQNGADPSLTEKAHKEMNRQSTADVSASTTEANNQLGTCDNNCLQEKPIMDKQPEEDNRSSPAEIRGYCGLFNQGATCYLNAVLQTLFMTEEFREAVKKLKKKKKKPVSFALYELFRQLESKTGCAETYGVTNALDIGNVCEQQDAAEYYQKILSEIEPNPAKIFQGKKKHSTTCINGNHEPIEEIISFFSLAIAMDSDQHKINVQKSLNTQFEVMHMNGEDQLFCEKCNKMMDMEMKCTIPELPEVLTLHLQRFYLDYNYMTYKKNNRRAQIPLQLSVQEERDLQNRVLYKYDLYAVVHHTGSLSGGHYYADIKSFEDEHWYQFNDSTVYRTQKRYNVSKPIISDTACLLFFRKYDQQEKTVMRSDKSEGLQSNRSSNPEDSRQHTDHISIHIENHHDSTVSNAQDPPAPLNSQNGADPSLTEKAHIEMNRQSTADVSASTTEANNQSGTCDNNCLQEKPIMDKQPEEDNRSSPAEIRELGITRSTSLKVRPEQPIQRSNTWPKEASVNSQKGRGECKSLQNNRTDIQIWLKPEEPDILSQQHTEFNTETEAKPSQSVTPDKEIKSADGDNDNQSKPNITFTSDHVFFTQQRMDLEPHESTPNDSDSDIEETGAQCNSLLQETIVSRKKPPLWFHPCSLFLIILSFCIFCIFMVLMVLYF